MKPYKTKRFYFWRLVAMSLRGLAKLISIWPLLLVAAFIVLPITPHVLWDTAEVSQGYEQSTRVCKYFGSRGVMRLSSNECQFIRWVDVRERD